MKRHNVVPGLSGYAQVNGRNLISWKENLNLIYIMLSMSFLDLKILILTFKYVFKAEGINSNINVTMENLMEKTSYLIYGGGAHSRVIISILEKMDIKIAGIFDIKNHVKLPKIPFLGSYDAKLIPTVNCWLVIIASGKKLVKISNTQ